MTNAIETIPELEARWALERKQALQAALDTCPIKSGTTVVRKNDKRQVKGVVKNRRARKDTVKGYYVVRVHCDVSWEGATNGARRFRGGQWNITTSVLADSLQIAN